MVGNGGIDSMEAEWAWVADTVPSRAGWGASEAERVWAWGSRRGKHECRMEEQGMGHNRDGVRMGGGPVRGAWRRGGPGWLAEVVKRVGPSLGISVRI